MQSLREQVVAARSGSREAFAALVGHYQGLVSATTLNMIGDFQQSEDIAQEAFLIAWNRLAELSDPQKFPAWVCGIARNCSKNWLRRQGRNPLAKSTELSETAEPANRERCSSPDDNARLVWQSLEDIPEAYREPMLMFYRHGAKIADIADALELSEEAVRQRLSRGRKLLKTEVERTVEKTLATTRPDTAFTLAVLAAIPLSASIGCSATSKSIGFYGGVAAMSGYGIFGLILAFCIILLLQTGPAALLAAVFFYAFWYAVKNSPTPRTRRFVIGATLDLNVFLWMIVPLLLSGYTLLLQGKTRPGFFNDYVNDLIFFCRVLSEPLRMTLFYHLPAFLLFAALTVYLVLRWRTLLAEDQTAEEKKVSTAETSPLVKIFEREINLIRRFRDYVLSPTGLCVKRNVVLVILAVSLVYSVVLQFRFYWYATHHPAWNLSSGTIFWLWFEFGLKFIVVWTVFCLFFRIVSKAIGISWDETTLEKTPPKIPLSDWGVEENRPADRRQILLDSFFLLITVPLVLIGFQLAAGLFQKFLFNNQAFEMIDFNTIIQTETVFVVLTALWISRNPSKRLLGISRLFLVGGLLAFVCIESRPLFDLASDFYGRELSETIGFPRQQIGTFEMQKMFFSFHLTAAAFLVYSLLAAAFCWFLQPAE